MSSLALDVFERLAQQVDQIEAVAQRAETDGFPEDAPVLRRSAFVLAIASIDTYFHDRLGDLLTAAALSSAGMAADVANYCQSVSASDVAGPSGEGLIRLRLSYKTLVAPRAIDAGLKAAGIDSDVAWRDTAVQLGSRPDRVRLGIELLYDRRNQIAHEGDWDLVQLEFRPMTQQDLESCLTQVRALARTMDPLL